MQSSSHILYYLSLFVSLVVLIGKVNAFELLSRKRRYLAFPKGSSFSVAVCATLGVIGVPEVSLNSYGLNWAIAFDLPNQTLATKQVKSYKAQNHRTKRGIFKHLETILKLLGYGDIDCILRALCESQTILGSGFGKKNMLDTMFQKVFSYSEDMLKDTLHPIEKKYHEAYWKNDIVENCYTKYPKCLISLLHLVRGGYST